MVVSVIRRTTSVCPACFRSLEAEVRERSGAVYLEKSCPDHGLFSLLLSRHPDYYKGLGDFYFSLIDTEFPQRDYIAHLTNKCELSCSICLAGANLRKGSDYPLQDLKDFLKGKKGYKIDLMGAEPTTREDLPEIIRAVKDSGNTASLHTNGIRISDPEYLKKLQGAGVDEVSLQFDGLDDSVYERIRGKRLLDVKKKALDNLQRVHLPANLVVTVVRGINENEMLRVVEFGLTRSCVKNILFLGCRFIGKARALPPESCLMPDELIDLLEAQSAGKISRQAVFDFQKLYFSLLSAFSVRKCFYIHNFLISRKKDSYLPIDRSLDLKRIQKKLEKFRRLKTTKSRFAKLYLVLSLAAELSRPGNWFWLRELLSFGLSSLRPFRAFRFSKKSVMLGFISSCDTYSFDSAIARNCGKGTLSLEFGVQDAGALNNIIADRTFTQGCKTG